MGDFYSMLIALNCRSSASLLSSTEALSPKQRRWPEDIAWHPEGNSVFAVYSADGGDSQISVLNLNKRKEVRVMVGTWKDGFLKFYCLCHSSHMQEIRIVWMCL